jgi:hypothetical protein
MTPPQQQLIYTPTVLGRTGYSPKCGQSYDNRGPSDSAFSVPGTDEFAWVVAVAIVSWCSPMVVFVNDGIRLLCVLRQFSLRLSTVTKQ